MNPTFDVTIADAGFCIKWLTKHFGRNSELELRRLENGSWYACCRLPHPACEYVGYDGFGKTADTAVRKMIRSVFRYHPLGNHNRGTK